MSDRPSELPETPDVRTIRQLVRLMHRYDLTAIDLAAGETKIRLRRRTVELPPAPAPAAPVASSTPDAPPFVTVGTAIRPETTVCIIEAMKVFTDIPAGMTGTVTEVLVKNGQPVEFEQPMFRVQPQD
jgi:acetyl-CoA carboxylase biotin carboxyl carrier protein